MTKQTQVRSTEEAPARSALKLALKELDEGHIYLAYGYIQEALASEAIEQPAQTDWEAVAADQAMTIALLKAEQPAQQEPDRVKFERHWRKTRGEKKANRELPRHPLQPQTYIQDSANRHWVTWQAAVRSVAPPAQLKPLTFARLCEIEEAITDKNGDVSLVRFARAIEANLNENT